MSEVPLYLRGVVMARERFGDAGVLDSRVLLRNRNLRESDLRQSQGCTECTLAVGLPTALRGGSDQGLGVEPFLGW